MRIVAQRVKQASVSIREETVAAIGPGIMALVGFGQQDGPDFHQTGAFSALARKLLDLRIFPAPDAASSTFQISLEEYGGSLLLVPQFTLYADCRRGRRPSFSAAGSPQWAENLFLHFVRTVDGLSSVSVSSGIFGADMDVHLCNWGPVTLLLDSEILYS
ncbi:MULTISPECIES: D-aminoacyl-tRNA deacylase [unclassified Desulfovibrio]|uniref:D-aminoacyl-tRNA deacylase n=1 Tax=unclassified Desulfovibrio TaxID=2593640 RepID=UPI000F5E8097|nr:MULTISPECIES: D-aminoacyl-tRNA deacylase [unclassified Desulfovibrio]RRD71566.1 D-tyrosyl-tRNA(Tyr) deacylase [Desulfovibrio sp. OH1209_COT-279]RRD87811.1 D-tyrosyl-tRNA(Tyr) deacylase [Desulfovibrio sp. OH1186_COT-070]